MHTYLTANDGANLVVGRGGGARYVWVAVAEAPRAVQVEACRSDSRSSHGGIMHRPP